MLKVIDLFAGIGGFSLGLQMAGGFETVQFVEIDPYCQKVLAKNFPGVPIHDDIRTFHAEKGSADIVCGGFPCVDISNAGKRAGITAPRSGLWKQMVRVLRVVGPRYGVVENVSALLVRGLGTVLGDLAEIGYDAEWRCIPASAVGAPHRRDRVWIVAYPIGSHGPCDGPLGRMGRLQQSVAWDGGWESALRRLRRMDDGHSYGVDRVRTLRNAVVPQVVAEIGKAIRAAA